MTRYHVSPETGNPGRCEAQAGNCPFGGEHQHYDSEAKARVAYELSMANQTVPEPTYSIMPEKTRAPYPIEGDTVVLGRGAGVSSSSLIQYEGKKGLVEDFNGSSYRVKFEDGTVHKVNWQFVKQVPGESAD